MPPRSSPRRWSPIGPHCPNGLVGLPVCRLIASISAASATFGKEDAIALIAELRDLKAKAAVGGVGGADGVPVAIDHFAAAMHMEGKLSDTPLDDLAFSHMRASWDSLQAGNWKVGKGVADLAVEGTEIELTELQTNTSNAEVVATGAFDLANGFLSRGRLWVNNFSAQELLSRLPEEARRALPGTINGTMSARIFLTESDPFHLAAHVELLCPERLLAIRTARAGGVSVVVGAAQGQPWGALSNLDLSGTVYYAFGPGSLPELSRGRLTADQFVLVSPQANGDPDAGVTVSKIKSDFTLTPEKAVLNDFYADLPGNGRIAAEGEFSLAGETAARAKLNFNGVDAALANQWLPPGWSLSGQIDTDIQLALSPRAAECALSVGLAPLTTLKGPDGTLSLTGVPPLLPSARFRGTWDRARDIGSIEAAEVSDIGALQADAGMTRTIQKIFSPPPGSALSSALAQLANGAAMSFDKLALTGRFAKSSGFSGDLALNGLDLGLGAEKASLLQNLTFKATVETASQLLDLQKLHVTAGQLLAERIALGNNVLTEIGANVSLSQGRLLVDKLAIGVAEGKVKGDAVITLPGQLESLHLDFSDLNQQALAQSLYPELFTAEGPVSGTAVLTRGESGLTGSLTLTADKPGNLKIAPPVSSEFLVPAARTAATAHGISLPDDFAEILPRELANYPYQSGHLTLRDAPTGMIVTLNYPRQPGQPGNAANPAFELQDLTLTVHNSVAGVLLQAAGWPQFQLGLKKPAPTPASRP